MMLTKLTSGRVTTSSRVSGIVCFRLLFCRSAPNVSRSFHLSRTKLISTAISSSSGLFRSGHSQSASSSLHLQLPAFHFQYTGPNIARRLDSEMDTDTNQMMEALKKCFRNENVNEILNFHGKLNRHLNQGCGNKFLESIDACRSGNNSQKKRELVNSISISYRFKQFYHRALSKLHFCTSVQKVPTIFFFLTTF